jgi:hypothetical protein
MATKKKASKTEIKKTSKSTRGKSTPKKVAKPTKSAIRPARMNKSELIEIIDKRPSPK